MRWLPARAASAVDPVKALQKGLKDADPQARLQRLAALAADVEGRRARRAGRLKHGVERVQRDLELRLGIGLVVVVPADVDRQAGV